MDLLFDFVSSNQLVRSSHEQERLAGMTRCLHTFIGHELVNALVPIQAFARMLEGVDSPFDGENRELAQRLGDLSQRLDTQARRLAGVGRLLREDPWGEPTEIASLVEEVLAEVKTRRPSPQVNFQVKVAATSISASCRMFHQVLAELLLNAIAACRDDLTIDLGICRVPGGVRIDVADRGVGLGELQAARLFHPYVHGPGLGLFLVRQCVSLWGGRLRIASVLGAGTLVELFIPDRIPPGDSSS